MKLLNQLKIGQRLALMAGLSLLLLGAIAAIGIAKLAELNRATAQIVEVEWTKTRLATVALDNARGSIARVFQIVESEDKAESAQARDRLAANIGEFEKALAELVPLVHSGDGKALLAKAGDARKVYVGASGRTLEALDQGDAARARKLGFGETYKAMHAFAASLRELNDYQQRRLVEQGAASAATYANARNLMLVLAALAMAGAVVLSVVVSRSITGPIAKAVQVAETVAAGDLRLQIDAQGRDETAQLLGALQRMNESLLGIVAQVRSGSESVATGSAQIATGNVDLSQRTEEQASNLQQTAASMEQLTSTVTQNADNARAASQLAAGASEVAARGGAVVARVVGTMGEISASSKRIADIIGTIDGIAFQTNILALNAAVEAARAGEQGRGFAVVASEVRSLAQRSAQAAKEIKDLIEQSVANVGDGARLVGEAGTTMDEIVAQVKRVNDLVGEISAASVEQARGIEQVGNAITQLDEVTQQNAALVEESAAAAESMKQQAARLTGTVAVFKLDGVAA